MIRKTMTAVGVGALCAVLAACGSRSDDEASSTPGVVPGTYSAPTVSTSTPAPSSLVCPGATQDADGKFVCPSETTTSATETTEAAPSGAVYSTASFTITAEQGYKARVVVTVYQPRAIAPALAGDAANPCNNIVGETSGRTIAYAARVHVAVTDLAPNGFAWSLSDGGSPPWVWPDGGEVAKPIRARLLCTPKAPERIGPQVDKDYFGTWEWDLAAWDTATPKHTPSSAAVRKAALQVISVGVQGEKCSTSHPKFQPANRWELESIVANICTLRLKP